MIEIEIDIAHFQAQVDRFVEDVQRGMLGVVQETCLDGAEHARNVGQFKDQTGTLRRSIRVLSSRRTERGGEASFGTDIPYARPVEGGQKPHTIAARGRALRWEQGGEIRFARLVHHPGAAAKPFMGPAAIKAEAALRARTETHVAGCIARASR
jgi:hypothetical protein